MQNYRYFAFISYSTHDVRWGKYLQQRLENYRLPTSLCRKKKLKRNPVSPVFFAPYDIQPGVLHEEIISRLYASKHLIVICSPHSARSEWVGKEIEIFHNLGRFRQIHFFIVDGTPNSEDPDKECFHPVLKKINAPELLGANIHEKVYAFAWMNRERAMVQLISKMLGIEFNEIWRRHRHRLLLQTVIRTICLVTMLSFALYLTHFNRHPQDVSVRLVETSYRNRDLPPMENAKISIRLDDETRTDTVANLMHQALFPNVPRQYFGRKIHLTFECKDYVRLDTTVLCEPDISINIRRDPAVYGNIRFTLWNPDTEQTLPGIALRVNREKTVSDKRGVVTLFIPLQFQKQKYEVVSEDLHINDTLFMPCGDSDIIRYLQ